MKIKRTVLENIIKQEWMRYVGNILEIDKKDKADVTDASKNKNNEPKELSIGNEPEVDTKLEKDVANSDEENADEITGGKIADEVAGKTIQSLSMEPKSKILPGAQEIVITFNQIPDPLRILITKQGIVKFVMKGIVHNTL